MKLKGKGSVNLPGFIPNSLNPFNITNYGTRSIQSIDPGLHSDNSSSLPLRILSMIFSISFPTSSMLFPVVFISKTFLHHSKASTRITSSVESTVKCRIKLIATTQNCLITEG